VKVTKAPTSQFLRLIFPRNISVKVCIAELGHNEFYAPTLLCNFDCDDSSMAPPKLVNKLEKRFSKSSSKSDDLQVSAKQNEQRTSFISPSILNMMIEKMGAIVKNVRL